MLLDLMLLVIVIAIVIVITKELAVLKIVARVFIIEQVIRKVVRMAIIMAVESVIELAIEQVVAIMEFKMVANYLFIEQEEESFINFSRLAIRLADSRPKARWEVFKLELIVVITIFNYLSFLQTLNQRDLQLNFME